MDTGQYLIFHDSSYGEGKRLPGKTAPTTSRRLSDCLIFPQDRLERRDSLLRLPKLIPNGTNHAGFRTIAHSLGRCSGSSAALFPSAGTLRRSFSELLLIFGVFRPMHIP